LERKHLKSKNRKIINKTVNDSQSLSSSQEDDDVHAEMNFPSFASGENNEEYKDSEE